MAEESGLRFAGVSVRFGGVRALESVNTVVAKGTIHGLIGPNGAGKTTMVNAVSGLVPLTEGTITWDGGQLPRQRTRLAAYGLARTFQTPVMFPDLTAVETVMVGGHSWTSSGTLRAALRTRHNREEEARLRAAATDVLRLVGYAHDPDARVSELSRASLGHVDLARALLARPRLLLLDEPTAGLTQGEIEHLHGVLVDLCTRQHTTILLVEHNVPFVFGLCHTVTALHDGRVVASGDPARVRADPALIESYLGRSGHPVPASGTVEHVRAGGGPAPSRDRADELTLRGVSSGYGRTTILRHVSLTVGAGEVVAVFGRNGAGKSTLLNTIVGSPRSRSGEITWRGRRIDRMTTDRLVRRGLVLVPQGGGVIAQQTVTDNLRLATFWVRLGRREVTERLDRIWALFPRLAERRQQLASNLSGGERQMLAIGKALMRAPRMLLLDEPSIGLAPAIVDELQSVIHRLRADGLPILITEQNASWVIPLADRAYLLDRGQIVRSGDAAVLASFESLTEEYLGKASPEHQRADGG